MQTAGMAERINVSSGGPLEAKAGYCRAVRIGDHVVVAGTTTLGPDGVKFPNDCYEQTRETLAIMGPWQLGNDPWQAGVRHRR